MEVEADLEEKGEADTKEKAGGTCEGEARYGGGGGGAVSYTHLLF